MCGGCQEGSYIMNTQFSAYEKIFVFGQVAENEYIFNIHIPSYCKDRIHLIFVFDKQPGYEHN